MKLQFTRRELLGGLAFGKAALSVALSRAGLMGLLSNSSLEVLMASSISKFKLGLITDEVSNDLEVAIKFLEGFDLHWVELRNLWHGYITEASPEDISRVKDLLVRHQMRISVIDTAFYKCLLPGTQSKFNSDPHSARTPTFEEQMDLLKRAIDRAKAFGVRYLRIFAFFRVDDPRTVYDRLVEELKKAVNIAAQSNMVLLLENEHSTNIATAKEAARLLVAIPSRYLALNWDPGNAFMAGETPYPDGYNLLDKRRIQHMHLKDTRVNPETGKKEWMPVGKGQIDYLGHFRALLKDRYQGTMSLETHYKNKANNKEESSRESMAGILDTIKKA